MDEKNVDFSFLFNFWIAAKNKLPSHTYYSLVSDAKKSDINKRKE